VLPDPVASTLHGALQGDRNVADGALT
jgi:hypothetical protein